MKIPKTLSLKFIDIIGDDVSAANDVLYEEHIAGLFALLEIEKDELDRRLSIMYDLLQVRYENALRVAFGNEKIGTKTITSNGYDIKVEIGKRVEWDSKVLLKGADRMVADNAQRRPEDHLNPDDYLTGKWSISETAWKAMPENTKKYFDGARTVKASRAKYTFTKAEK